MRVLGLDPGSRFTGYGLLDWVTGAPKHVADGVISLAAADALPLRLAALSKELGTVIETFKPDAAAVESVFAFKNIRSTLVLAQARGAILAVLGRHGLDVYEYSPAEVKTTVTGYGRAEKLQMRRMTQVLLGLPAKAAVDASDALAVAICHLRHARLSARPQHAGGR